jgi:hypothetical protein
MPVRRASSSLLRGWVKFGACDPPLSWSGPFKNKTSPKFRFMGVLTTHCELASVSSNKLAPLPPPPPPQRQGNQFPSLLLLVFAWQASGEDSKGVVSAEERAQAVAAVTINKATARELLALSLPVDQNALSRTMGGIINAGEGAGVGSIGPLTKAALPGDELVM